MIQRTIPSSGEKLHVIGLGTWQTFDTNDKSQYPNLRDILDQMHKYGAEIIDSSPMYGNSEKVIGDITIDIGINNSFFYATKVWTKGEISGIKQMENSMRLMRRESIDLMQVHNLTDWKTHLKTLQHWKEIGKIKYIGITHYLDSMHEELERIIKAERIDFVQFNYSIDSRNAEKRLLCAAADNGVATIINRPFGEGLLFKKVRGKSIPQWAVENDIKNWSSFFLKYIISNPAVTCVIPATSNPFHAAENFKAGNSSVSENVQKKMTDYLMEL